MRQRVTVAIAILILLAAVAAAIRAIAAADDRRQRAALLHRAVPSSLPRSERCAERVIRRCRRRLAGWVCAADAVTDRPTVVYLHGIADNRDSSIGVIDRFLPRGFNVIAYDSRGHGAIRRRSLHLRILRETDLQPRARSGRRRSRDPDRPLARRPRWRCRQPRSIRRIHAVVAASTFADLRSIATERAPSSSRRR